MQNIIPKTSMKIAKGRRVEIQDFLNAFESKRSATQNNYIYVQTAI